MTFQRILTSRKVLLALLCSLLIAGCSNDFAQSVRKLTYPPDFTYTEPSELRSDMDTLAQQMILLDTALDDIYVSNNSNENEWHRERVLGALKEMSKTAYLLQEGDAGGNHPYLQAQLRDFSAKVDQARSAASLAKPNYYYAAKVSASCTNCHAVNRN